MTTFQILDKHRRSGGNTDIDAAMREYAISFAEWLPSRFTLVDEGIWVWYDEVDYKPEFQRRLTTLDLIKEFENEK